MTQIFIELYRYRDAWLEKSQRDREAFGQEILDAMAGIEAAGVEVVGWGFNDVGTDHRADYDFFCVYNVPSVEFQREFEKNIAASGWHDLFEQIAVSGTSMKPAAVMSANVALARPDRCSARSASGLTDAIGASPA